MTGAPLPFKGLFMMATALAAGLAPSVYSFGTRASRSTFIAAINPRSSTLVSSTSQVAWKPAGSRVMSVRGISGGGLKMSAEEKFIKEKISKPCVVFSKTYCPFCTKAKNTLQKEGAKFEVIELDVVSNGDAIQKTLAQMTGRRTVPNVFVGGKTIGGGDDTAALSSSGKLKAMLKEAGAL